MTGEQVRESFQRVLGWTADDQEKLGRFVQEIEEWRADEVSDGRRDVAKAV